MTKYKLSIEIQGIFPKDRKNPWYSSSDDLLWICVFWHVLVACFSFSKFWAISSSYSLLRPQLTLTLKSETTCRQRVKRKKSVINLVMWSRLYKIELHLEPFCLHFPKPSCVVCYLWVIINHLWRPLMCGPRQIRYYCATRVVNEWSQEGKQ